MNAVDLLSRTVIEGIAIGFAICVLRTVPMSLLKKGDHAKSTAVFSLVITAVVPYGGKVLELLLEGPAGEMAAQGYTQAWLLTAVQGRIVGAAIGVALVMALASELRRRSSRAH